MSSLITKLTDKQIEVITRLSFNAGIRQFSLEYNTKQKTGFSSPVGMYAYNVLPETLTGGIPIVTATLLEAFKNEPNVFVAYDEVLMFSSSISAHLEELDFVLKAINCHHLMMYLSYSQMCLPSLVFMCCIIDRQGKQAHAGFRSAAEAYPIPTMST
jgi:hypothetical protein